MQCKSYLDFMTEYENYKPFLMNYKKTKEKFYDLNFHPQRHVNETEISFDDVSIEWKRIDEIYDAPLFDEKLINIDFVQQGKLGDCSFISAISRIARDPILVSDLFDHTADTILGPITNSINIECGAVVIYFHAFGRETPVLIDTLIPFNRYTTIPLFSRPVSRKVSPWFCLVEKAFAKLQGSYSNISGVSFTDSIYYLFGYDKLSISFSELFKKTPFEKIEKYLKKGAVMSTSINSSQIHFTNDQLKMVGLIPSHSYLIEKALVFNGMRFLFLRNPWGVFEWNGDWSNNSPLWTEEIKRGLNIKNGFEEGTFWMIEKDFNRYFTTLMVSRPIPPDWHSKSFTTEMWNCESDGYEPEDLKANLDQLPNFVFQITDDVPPNEKVSVYFLIERRSYLQSGAELIDKDPSIFYLLLVNSIGLKLTHEIYIQSMRTKVLSSLSISGYKFTLDEDNKSMITICLQRALKCDFEEECSVRVSCKYNFKLYNIDSPNDLIPDNENGQAVFNNDSLVNSISLQPNYKKKRAIVVNPDEIEKDEEIEMYIEYLNKKSELLKIEKEDIQKKLNPAIENSLKIQNELKVLVQNVETLDYDDEKLILVVGEIEERRRLLEEAEKEIDSFLAEIGNKEKESELVNKQINALQNKKNKILCFK